MELVSLARLLDLRGAKGCEFEKVLLSMPSAASGVFENQTLSDAGWLTLWGTKPAMKKAQHLVTSHDLSPALRSHVIQWERRKGVLVDFLVSQRLTSSEVTALLDNGVGPFAIDALIYQGWPLSVEVAKKAGPVAFVAWLSHQSSMSDAEAFENFLSVFDAVEADKGFSRKNFLIDYLLHKKPGFAPMFATTGSPTLRSALAGSRHADTPYLQRAAVGLDVDGDEAWFASYRYSVMALAYNPRALEEVLMELNKRLADVSVSGVTSDILLNSQRAVKKRLVDFVSKPAVVGRYEDQTDPMVCAQLAREISWSLSTKPRGQYSRPFPRPSRYDDLLALASAPGAAGLGDRYQITGLSWSDIVAHCAPTTVFEAYQTSEQGRLLPAAAHKASTLKWLDEGKAALVSPPEIVSATPNRINYRDLSNPGSSHFYAWLSAELSGGDALELLISLLPLWEQSMKDLVEAANAMSAG